MTMLKSVSLSIFVDGCLALYLSVLMLMNPTLPGATNLADTRMAYSFTVLMLAFACCVVSGLTWSHAAKIRAGVAVGTAVSLWFVLLVAFCFHLGIGDRMPL